jgi:hypothetical protein
MFADGRHGPLDASLKGEFPWHTPPIVERLKIDDAHRAAAMVSRAGIAA